MHCLKNTILKVITVINIISFIVFAGFIDAWIPLIICSFNLAWLWLFCKANDWFEGRWRIWHKRSYLNQR